ncbi:hypothetical protein G6321_00019115 [Bradyrhizobium barranii subsp. barranii]|uniref:Uncharacterized protein n=1 Tax=Bradyrhizobium barranii subsp. barranii TaxID=2823807 RepID=A0A7Z0QMI3_9BRAD|nr:hypothetical protein [Bradyrhizobium barranii]UGX97123.1 hypothetical protein G6321_00019115 [Bradyrhizobium barranii subsp. barranii]
MLIVDNSPLRDVRIYKVFHPHPMIYSFNRAGLMHFASATEYDRKEGKYASNNNRAIRKCDALYLDSYQREPAREIQFFANAQTPNLSISPDTLIRIISQHLLTTPDHSFETPRDFRLFFEKGNYSLNDAECVFKNYVDQLAMRFPHKCRERRK